MLNKLRNFSKTKLAGVLIGIIVIPFVFWGMGSVFSGGNTNNIAKINNETISTQEFLNYINNTSIDKNYIKNNLDNNVIESIISKIVSIKLLDMEIGDSGIAEELAILAADPALTSIGPSQDARAAGLLEGYNRGDYEFAEYMADVIERNWREFKWIEYDVKALNRAKLHLEMRANIKMSAQQYKKINPYNLIGWLVSYDAEDGPIVDEEFDETGL